jgi:CHAD domain-containing protein
MFSKVTPIGILQSHSRTLLSLLPRVQDGDVETVHAARVVSRRIREVVPLTHEWYRRDTVTDLEDRFRRIGRSLGRVRDADARIALLAYLETRVPSAAPSLVVLGHERERERLELMRKLIKRFERFEVDRLLGDIAGRGRGSIRPWTRIAGGWRERLRRTLAERARTAGESVHHATGIYFPNRSHRTRIAVKKFRYAVEIASATGVGPAAGDALRHLNKTQDVLGDLHDRQVLVDELPKEAIPHSAEVDADQIRLVVQIVEAECRDLHARYLHRRPELLQICSRTERAFAERRMSIAPIATAIAFSSAVYLWRRATTGGLEKTRERDVSVRIPIPGTAPIGR